jgi:hypothetical protein
MRRPGTEWTDPSIVTNESMTNESEFLELSAEKLLVALSRIEACLEHLPPEQVWYRHSENENAIGNLMIHLEANVRQYILSGIGGAVDQRNRDAEFDARDASPVDELQLELRQTVDQAAREIRAFPAQRLGEHIEVQGRRRSVLATIYHCVEHFNGHAGQIIFATKWMTGRDLGFFAHLRGSGRYVDPVPSHKD